MTACTVFRTVSYALKSTMMFLCLVVCSVLIHVYAHDTHQYDQQIPETDIYRYTGIKYVHRAWGAVRRLHPGISSSEGGFRSESLAGAEDLASTEDIAGAEDIAGVVTMASVGLNI